MLTKMSLVESGEVDFGAIAKVPYRAPPSQQVMDSVASPAWSSKMKTESVQKLSAKAEASQSASGFPVASGGVDAAAGALSLV